MKKKSLLISIFCIALIFTACQKEERKSKPKLLKKREKFKVVELSYDTSLPNKDGVENTIRAYNITVRNALIADPYVPEIRKYATDRETQRIFIESDVDTQKGIAMRSWQKELVFENISVSNNNAYADTMEIWDFEFVDIKTKEIVEPKKRIRYTLKYSLEMEEGKWRVAKIEEREAAQMIIKITPKKSK